MNNPSPAVEVSPPVNVSFKPLLPPPTLTRWQKFCNFMKTPESGLVPLGIMVIGAHLYTFHYLFFSDDYVDDFEDDEEATTLAKKLLAANKSVKEKFNMIRENFSGFKG